MPFKKVLKTPFKKISCSKFTFFLLPQLKSLSRRGCRDFLPSPTFSSSSKNTCTDCYWRMSLPITSCVSFLQRDKNECEKVCFYIITTARQPVKITYIKFCSQPPHCTHKKKQSSAPLTQPAVTFLFSLQKTPAFFPNCQLFFPSISFINSRRQQVVTKGEEKEE